MTILALLTIWYVPGWLRTAEPQAGTLESLRETYSAAAVEFRRWDGDLLYWPNAVASADREAERLAAEIAGLPESVRTNLTLVGHSLGGRITARTLARLDDRGLKVRRGILLAAAIPQSDGDLARMGGGSVEPIVAVCNPDDVTLRYIYALAGGERDADYGAVAYGANGSLTNLFNVTEYVVPTNYTAQVAIEQLWGKSDTLKEIANHHALFYLDYLRRIVRGEADADHRVMVPQHRPNFEFSVIDAEIWWDVIEEFRGWKLERHVLTGHCRILDPGKVRRAWGGEAEMRAAFEKMKAQVEPAKKL